ncbi:MAG: hypothetical protein ACTSSI_10155 [Candidatus Helarchaeota archaeon]
MNQRICSAILSRKIIRFFYKGGIRLVEPYCYGISTRGNEVLRAYQISGYSESGENVGWKLFKVSDISDFSITDGEFSKIRPKYKPNDSAMTKIFCNI